MDRVYIDRTRVITLLFVMLFQIACESKEEIAKQEAERTAKHIREVQANTKIIKDKQQYLDNGISGWALVLDGKIKPTVKTKFMLISEDGCSTEVSAPVYFRTAVGDKYYAYSWSCK